MQSIKKTFTNDEGIMFWLCNGEIHREDGPAVIYPSGAQIWYKDGLRHREDGPAVINPNGDAEWYIDGVKIKVHPSVEAQHRGTLVAEAARKKTGSFISAPRTAQFKR